MKLGLENIAGKVEDKLYDVIDSEKTQNLFDSTKKYVKNTLGAMAIGAGIFGGYKLVKNSPQVYNTTQEIISARTNENSLEGKAYIPNKKEFHSEVNNNENTSPSTKYKEIASPEKKMPFFSTEEGRFERSRRWDDLMDKAEEKYNIQKGLLAGLMMRESYGNPVQLPKNNDAGAGLFMFQPGTARAYGLKTIGTSNHTGADSNHGEKLREIARKYNYSYAKLSKLDDRFNPRKSIDAAARFLRDLDNRYHDWDKALSAYNSGTPEKNYEDTPHVKAVRKFQQYYLKREMELENKK